MIRGFNNHRYSKAYIQFVEILNELNQKELFEIQSIIDNYIDDESLPFVKNEISGFGMLAIDMAFRKTRINKKEIGYSAKQYYQNNYKTINRFFDKIKQRGNYRKF